MKTSNEKTHASCMTFLGSPNLKFVKRADSTLGQRDCLNCGYPADDFLPVFAEKQILALCRECLLFFAAEADPVSPTDRLLAIHSLASILEG